MSARDRNTDSGRVRPSRRQFLLGGAVAGAGAAAAIGIDYATRTGAASAPAPAQVEQIHGTVTVPFYGVHQAGIDTPHQAHATLVGLDLLPDTDRDALRRLMRILTDDAARLTQGRGALADTEPELARTPARLTVTFGVGEQFVARAGEAAPAWLRPLPPFSVDRLDPQLSDGDLVMQIAGDDPLAVAHATRMLLKDARSFARLRWTQHGFTRAYGSEESTRTMRNLFGQVDGTANPRPGTPEFDATVWASGGWLAGGTSMVVRRIRMDLDGWDELDRVGRELSVGRTLATGAPLTGSDEFDEPDFEAIGASGFPVIPDFAHMRRARGDGRERIFRRSFNYDAPGLGESVSESGLVFISFQADPDAQFVPMQRRLDELDLLNQWTTPIGSSVVAILPGCEEGGYIGETLLD